MPYNLIEYNGKMLTLSAIAKKEGLIDITLKRYYKYTNEDIYRAVKLCKEVSRGKVNKIEYNGEMLPIYLIAKKNNLTDIVLKDAYIQTKDIYEAIRICQQRKSEKQARAEERKKKEQSEQKEYYGMQMALKEIAKMEGLDAKKLKQYYKETQSVYKAVSILKIQETKNKKVEFNNFSIDLYDMSILLNVKYRDLINLINSGMTINEINEKYVKNEQSEQIKLHNKRVLLEFCIQKNLNFAFLYRAINTYGKSLPEAIEECRKNDKALPDAWIMERYETILAEAQIPNYQFIAIRNELQNNKISLEDAIEICVIRKNARNYGISEQWGETVYGIAKTRQMIGDEYERKFEINSLEQAFIKDSEQEIDVLVSKAKEISALHQTKRLGDIKLNDGEQEL